MAMALRCLLLLVLSAQAIHASTEPANPEPAELKLQEDGGTESVDVEPANPSGPPDARIIDKATIKADQGEDEGEGRDGQDVLEYDVDNAGGAAGADSRYGPYNWYGGQPMGMQQPARPLYNQPTSLWGAAPYPQPQRPPVALYPPQQAGGQPQRPMGRPPQAPRPSYGQQQSQSQQQQGCCPSGWLVWGTSCYYIERHNKATYEDALQQCRAQRATLFRPDSSQEWDAIRREAVATQFSWIGVKQNGYSGSGGQTGSGSSSSQGYGAQWGGSLNISELPWLNKVSPHGASASTSCAAYYQPPVGVQSGQYTHYYTCLNQNLFICERNTRQPSGGFGG